MLHPGVKILGRKCLSGRLLDEEHQRVQVCFWFGEGGCIPPPQAHAKGELDGQRGTLSIDGWSNIQNTPVLGLGVRGWLLDVVDTTGKPHTSEYLQEVMVYAVELAKTVLGVIQVPPVLNNFRILQISEGGLPLPSLPW